MLAGTLLGRVCELLDLLEQDDGQSPLDDSKWATSRQVRVSSSDLLCLDDLCSYCDIYIHRGAQLKGNRTSLMTCRDFQNWEDALLG